MNPDPLEEGGPKEAREKVNRNRKPVFFPRLFGGPKRLKTSHFQLNSGPQLEFQWVDF